MEFLKIVLLSVLAAVIYGVLHDQITARVCVEYFTVGHPRVFGTDDPTALALGWGVIATWWVGLLLGLPLAFAARAGPRPPLTARLLVRPLALLMGCVGLLALAAGTIGFHRPPLGSPWLRDMLDEVPPEKHAAFHADVWAHAASYLFGAVGAVAVWVWAWRERGKSGAGSRTCPGLVGESLLWDIVEGIREALAEQVGDDAVGRLLGCLLGAAVGPFAVMSIYLLVSRGVTGFSGVGDCVGLGASLLSGVGCVFGLPVPVWARALLVVLYLPVVGCVLVVYTLFFVGFVFGDWL